MGEAFEGVEWRLVAYDGPAGELMPVPGNVSVSATFEDGRVAGSSGCNRYSAEYRQAGESLAVGPAAGTLMACGETEMEVEGAFLAALGAVAGMELVDGRLTLLDATARPLLRFRASLLHLSDTTWEAVAVNNGRGGVEGLRAGTRIDARFDDAGTVSGTAGCNRYHGSWTAVGATLAIGPLAATRMACPEPDGVMDQEAAFLAAMTRVATWRIDLDRLELRDADGALQVAFRAPHGAA